VEAQRARYWLPGTVAAVTDLTSERLTDPPRLDDPALATRMSPFALPRALGDETGLSGLSACCPEADQRERGSRRTVPAST
jgi:hypothetical protein